MSQRINQHSEVQENMNMATINLRARIKKADGRIMNRKFTAEVDATKDDILELATAQVREGEELRGIDVILAASRTPGIWANEYAGPNPDVPIKRWLQHHERHLQLAREAAK